jgi:CubicO group peptidase (beta-lactamase class C family)
MVLDGRTPGVQYAFVCASGARLFHHAGMADPATRAPVTQRTTFNAYSVTKMLTAAATIQLVERGRVDLDRPLAHYLARWPHTGTATVRQVLLHTAGLPNPNPLSWVHLAEEHPRFDRTRFVDEVLQAHAHAVRAPATRYAYSNIGYLLLGELIAQVSGQPYTQCVRQRLIEPLTLAEDESLSFEIAHANDHARGAIKRFGWIDLVLGWMLDRQRLVYGTAGRWLLFRHHQVNGDAYGGLIANAAGLCRFMMALCSGEGLLCAHSRALLLGTARAPGPQRSLAGPTGTLSGHAWCAHAGGGAGYYCEARIYPALQCASAVMFNRAGMRDEKILDRIDRHLVASLD